MKNFTITIMTLLMLTGCKPAPKNFVSGYDFLNARLVDLPWEMGAVIIGPGSSFDYDGYIKKHCPDWNYIQHRLGKYLFDELSFVPSDSTNHVYTVDDPALIIPQYESVDDSCRLVDGKLWYELEVVGGVVTTSSNRWFLLELEVLEYKDFNRDGFMDVSVVRRLPGSAAPWEELVLSRRAEDDRFYVVEHRERWCRGME